MEVDRIRDDAKDALEQLKLQCVPGQRVLDTSWYQEKFNRIGAYMDMIEKSDHVGGGDELLT